MSGIIRNLCTFPEKCTIWVKIYFKKWDPIWKFLELSTTGRDDNKTVGRVIEKAEVRVRHPEIFGWEAVTILGQRMERDSSWRLVRAGAKGCL